MVDLLLFLSILEKNQKYLLMHHKRVNFMHNILLMAVRLGSEAAGFFCFVLLFFLDEGGVGGGGGGSEKYVSRDEKSVIRRGEKSLEEFQQGSSFYI